MSCDVHRKYDPKHCFSCYNSNHRNLWLWPMLSMPQISWISQFNQLLLSNTTTKLFNNFWNRLYLRRIFKNNSIPKIIDHHMNDNSLNDKAIFSGTKDNVGHLKTHVYAHKKKKLHTPLIPVLITSVERTANCEHLSNLKRL